MRAKASLGSGLGGKDTAKRKIQIRKYLTAKIAESCVWSDPFQEEPDDSPILKPRNVKFSFKTDYIPDESDSTEDEILKQVDLDEADRFLAALKIPKNPSRTNYSPKVVRNYAKSATADLDEFRAQTERLEKARMKESIGDSEDDE